MIQNPAPLSENPTGSLSNGELPEPGKIPWALFLDVDGTLVEIAVEPDAVHVDIRLITLLTALQRKLDGAVALVSGRKGFPSRRPRAPSGGATAWRVS